MAEQGTHVPGEGEGSSANPVLEQDKYEVAARKAGWKPEDDWTGSPEDWVPAREFVGRQKLFDKIHDLRNQLSRQATKFEQDMSRISGHFAKVQETEYKRARKDLESQLRAAKAEGDVEQVAEIAGQIKEVEQGAKEAKAEVKAASSGGPTPEYVEWQRRNDWFTKDPEMTGDAIAIGTGYASANPSKTQTEVLEYVEKKIKRLYPDNFEEVKGKKVEENRVEGGGRSSAPVKKKGQLAVGDLSEMEVQVMRTLIKRNALKDMAAKNKRTQQEEYLAQLSERKAAGE